MKKYRIIMVLVIFTINLILPNISNKNMNTVLADSAVISQLSVTSNPATNQVSIQGNIASGEGKWVTVTVINPNQSIVYIDQTKSSLEGRYQFSFMLNNPVNGEYGVNVHDSEANERITSTFLYNKSDNSINSPPTVNITSPTAGTQFTAPASVTIRANAVDSDGTINKVEFYNGTTKLGEATSVPYEYIWTNVAAGTYVIKAVCTDNDGAVAESATVNIVVNAPQSNDDNTTPSTPHMPTPTVAPGPTAINDILQKAKDVAAYIEKPDATVKEVMEKVKELIKYAAGIKADERDQLKEVLEEVIEKAINKAGKIVEEDIDKIVTDNKLKVQIGKEAVSKQVNSVIDVTNELTKELKEAQLNSVVNIALVKMELQLELKDVSSEEVNVGISVGSIKELASKGVAFSIKTTNVTFKIPPDALQTSELNNASSNSQVEISYTEINKEKISEFTNNLNLSSSEKNKLVPVGKVFDFNAEVTEGSTLRKLDRFKEKITVELSYTGTSANVDKLGAYRYNPEKKVWDYVGGRVDRETQKVTFKTGHFSIYSLMEYTRSFDDIESHWAKENIEIMASKHIVNGVDEKKFEPDRTVTRAEFTAFVVRALDLETVKNKMSFKDVKQDEWYADYIQTAADAGLVTGFAGEFRPQDTITREEMAVLIVRAYDFASSKKIESGDQNKFTDSDELSSWAVDAVISASKLGLINGVDSNRFMPKGNANRAQSATIVRRLLDIL